MVKNLGSKITITVYILAAIGIGFWGYTVFKQRDGKVVVTSTQKINTGAASSSSDNQNQNNNNTSNDQSSDVCTDGTTCSANPAATDNTANTNSDNTSTSTPADSSAAPVNATQNVSGNMLAHITPEHCSSNCQAFASDLSLLEYCQEACGISPIKKVSNCDNKKDIQKDYCLKDLAITNEDASKCDSINDVNIKQACKNRITQDAIENNL